MGAGGNNLMPFFDGMPSKKGIKVISPGRPGLGMGERICPKVNLG